jgi:hypothetical protein
MALPSEYTPPRCKAFDADYGKRDRFRKPRKAVLGLPEEECVSPRCKAFDPGYDKKGKSRKQEKRIAELIGGRIQPASGATKRDLWKGTSHSTKGDVCETDFLIEAKRTDTQSLHITGEWLFKIQAHADMSAKLPALAFEIGGYPLLQEKDWVAVPASVFKKLLKGIK